MPNFRSLGWFFLSAVIRCYQLLTVDDSCQVTKLDKFVLLILELIYVLKRMTGEKFE